MTDHPALEGDLELFVISRSNAIVAEGDRLFQFRGPGVADLLAELDGSTALPDLYRAHGEAATRQVLDELRRRGLLNEEREDASLPQAASPGVKGPNLIDPFGVGAGTLARAFDAAAGFAPAIDGVQIVLTDSFLRAELADLAQRAAERGVTWILVKPEREGSLVGPVFAPGRAPCWSCFLGRLLAQDDARAFLARHARFGRGTSRLTPATARMVVPIVEDLLAGRDDLSGCGVVVHLQEGRPPRPHVAAARPGCRCAAGHIERSPPPIRASFPEAVDARLRALADPLTGILGEAIVCEDRSGNPVKVAAIGYADPSAGRLGRFALDALDGRLLGGPVARVGFGGGRTEAEAAAKAALEALERYCGIFQGDEPAVLASWKELSPAAVHPNDLLAAPDPIERPFDPDARILWSPVESSSGSVRYAPTACCYQAVGREPDDRWCTHDSNGTAAALTRDQAVMHALLELVERDAVAIWWYTRARRPRVRLDSFGDDFVGAVAGAHRRLDRDLRVFDLTTDLGITVFAATSLRPGEAPLLGFGADQDAGRALERALIELGQAACFIEQEAVKWRGVSLADQPQLEGDGQERTADQYAGATGPATLDRCLDRLTAAGLELLVKDCTRRDVGLPVVKAMVPGLRPARPCFAPGRLFDLPVTLGWRARPPAIGDLNPLALRM